MSDKQTCTICEWAVDWEWKSGPGWKEESGRCTAPIPASVSCSNDYGAFFGEEIRDPINRDGPGEDGCPCWKAADVH